MSDIIELENSKDNYPDPDWIPKEGEIFNSIIRSLPKSFSHQEKETLINETKSILGKCINPEHVGTQKNTGLCNRSCTERKNYIFYFFGWISFR